VLLGVPRSTIYYRAHPRPVDDRLLRAIDRVYTAFPFMGRRQIHRMLKAEGAVVNLKTVHRAMRILGMAAVAPGPHTSKPHPQHPKYPYLLRGVAIDRPNQVWSADVTYLPMARGFQYLVAVVDWFSRKVLSWRVSNSLDAGFCVEALEEALRRYGAPEIFNTDQGAQFTSEAFLGVLRRHDVRISMDGKGRALDNVFVERLWRTVKYEHVYLRPADTDRTQSGSQELLCLVQWRKAAFLPRRENPGGDLRRRFSETGSLMFWSTIPVLLDWHPSADPRSEVGKIVGSLRT
jgi:putative transposase